MSTPTTPQRETISMQKACEITRLSMPVIAKLESEGKFPGHVVNMANFSPSPVKRFFRDSVEAWAKTHPPGSISVDWGTPDAGATTPLRPLTPPGGVFSLK